MKGRVDHKEAGKTCLVVQGVEEFDPSAEEIERARAQAAGGRPHGQSAVRARAPARAGRGLSRGRDRRAQADDRGLSRRGRDLDRAGDERRATRRLRLGSAYRVQHTPTLRAELEHALGAARRCRPAPRRPTRAQRSAGAPACAPRSRSSSSRARLPRGRALARSRRASRARRAGAAGRAPTGTRAARVAQLARADVRVAVAVGAERGLGVVQVQRAHAPAAEQAPRAAHDGVHAGWRADVIARGEQVAGVQAHAEALVAAGGLEQLRQLLQGAAEGSAGAGGVLQMQLTALAVLRAPRRSSPRLVAARIDRPRLRRAGVQDDPASARSADPRAASWSARQAIWRGCRRPRWRS